MRIKVEHVPYIAQKVAVDLSKSGIVRLTRGLEPVAAEAKKVLENNIKEEAALDEKVHDMLEANEDAIEEQLADDRKMFFMIKKKLAAQFNVILDYEERFSDIAHKILDELYEEDLMAYDIEEIRIKNVIYSAMTGFISETSVIEDTVYEKIKGMEKKIYPGSVEYDILFEKFYREELVKRGMA